MKKINSIYYVVNKKIKSLNEKIKKIELEKLELESQCLNCPNCKTHFLKEDWEIKKTTYPNTRVLIQADSGYGDDDIYGFKDLIQVEAKCPQCEYLLMQEKYYCNGCFKKYI